MQRPGQPPVGREAGSEEGSWRRSRTRDALCSEDADAKAGSGLVGRLPRPRGDLCGSAPACRLTGQRAGPDRGEPARQGRGPRPGVLGKLGHPDRLGTGRARQPARCRRGDRQPTDRPGRGDLPALAPRRALHLPGGPAEEGEDPPHRPHAAHQLRRARLGRPRQARRHPLPRRPRPPRRPQHPHHSTTDALPPPRSARPRRAASWAGGPRSTSRAIATAATATSPMAPAPRPPRASSASTRTGTRRRIRRSSSPG